MAKKTYEPYFITSLNVDGLKRLKPNVTSQEIERLSNDYKKLIGQNRHGNPFLPKLVQLNGKKGEIAYVRDDSYYRHSKITLITEFPLSFSAEEQRKWISMASKFFKAILTVKLNITASNYAEFISFKRKLHPPYGFRDDELGYIKVFPVKFNTPAPYASKTTRKQDLQARNKWIKERYKELKKDKTFSKYSTRYSKISDESEGKKFGNLIIKKPLAIYTIKNILYSKSQKISD